MAVLETQIAPHRLLCESAIYSCFTQVSGLWPLGLFFIVTGVVGWCEGAVYLPSLGRPTDIGLQLGKACYPCSG